MQLELEEQVEDESSPNHMVPPNTPPPGYEQVFQDKG